ncbi:MAG: 30S ribosomal protein S17 [Spirochaetaceae bacterium]|nr:30S ribosomal protein S17 [Spirochaetaceae bacterium]
MSSTERLRVLAGTVVSDRMDKTIVVLVSSQKRHPMYEKYIRRSKRVKAHDAENECNIGDRVRVVESRPLSRDKRWRLLEIVERSG